MASSISSRQPDLARLAHRFQRTSLSAAKQRVEWRHRHTLMWSRCALNGRRQRMAARRPTLPKQTPTGCPIILLRWLSGSATFERGRRHMESSAMPNLPCWLQSRIATGLTSIGHLGTKSDAVQNGSCGQACTSIGGSRKQADRVARTTFRIAHTFSYIHDGWDLFSIGALHGSRDVATALTAHGFGVSRARGECRRGRGSLTRALASTGRRASTGRWRMGRARGSTCGRARRPCCS